MIDINLIRTKQTWVKEQLLKRGFKADFAGLLKADEEKRKLLQQVEEMRAERNRVTADIAKIKREKRNADSLVSQMQKIGKSIADGEARLSSLDAQVYELMSTFPNIPAEDVIAGGKESNKVVKTFGRKPVFGFKPKDHVELCTKLGLIDYERAAKISGARTWVYTGVGAMLEWALLNYFIDFHISNGYTFILPPHLLNYESGYAAGQFPKFQHEVFCTSIDDGETPGDTKSANFRFLLPTAETALINMHRGEIIPESKLPIKYAGYSPCYRNADAGYGSKERGMRRGFQFNKVEMIIFCKAKDGDKLLAELIRNAEKLLEGLGLHYQTVALAAGDCSAAMAKTVDIEVFFPSANAYQEVSSGSTAHDYQARRGNIKVKTDAGNEYVHTLNCSGLATSRIVPAIVEQFQQADGSVIIPNVLDKYMHGVKVIKQ